MRSCCPPVMPTAPSAETAPPPRRKLSQPLRVQPPLRKEATVIPGWELGDPPDCKKCGAKCVPVAYLDGNETWLYWGCSEECWGCDDPEDILWPFNEDYAYIKDFQRLGFQVET